MTADTELVTAAVAGDRQAAAELIDRHAAAVYAVCLGQLGDPDRAEDAAQDSLLKAFQRLGSLRDSAIFRSWLLVITRNHCRDLHRTARRHRNLLAERMEETQVEIVGGETAVAGLVPGMGAGPIATGESSRSELDAALARLPEKHRLPLLLFYFDGLSSARVAEALDISVSGASARLCRARRALREILEVRHG